MSYLVKHWVDGEVARCETIEEAELVKELDFAYKHGQTISIHEIGECVIDWSFDIPLNMEERADRILTAIRVFEERGGCTYGGKAEEVLGYIRDVLRIGKEDLS